MLFAGYHYKYVLGIFILISMAAWVALPLDDMVLFLYKFLIVQHAVLIKLTKLIETTWIINT